MRLRGLVKKGRDTQFFLFAGKGGVGKTSMAAAAAVRLSKGGKRVLIISTDPAHSLSDSFETGIGGKVKQIGKNLFAVEIDPKLAMSEYKDKLMPKLEGMDALKGLGLGDTFDMMGMTPGIDEIAAIDKFLHYMQSDDYDAVIFDTAPTGHTLRFLSLPDVLDSWVGKMIMLRMRFAGMANLVKKILPFSQQDERADAGLDKLKEMKARVGEAKKILTDPRKTHYNLVMIPEEMSILESERSLAVLGEYGIPVGSIIVNQIIPANAKCGFCSEKRKQQLERLKSIRQRFKRYPIREVPLFRHEVKGRKVLEEVGKEIFSGS
ncbi:MAG: ArsA family ATPase [Candidatus Aenigmarchaeota archaeon]|nr:ArsA family ATPase [Candidatus Aenigmarchaeota archaeon]